MPRPRLIAIDIDGTLLDLSHRIPEKNHHALRRAHDAGIQIVLVTGRRHAFALPIAQQLGFDLWLISSNGAVTRSLAGETFHRDLLPVDTARALCRHMQDFRRNLVVTFDREGPDAIAVEANNEMNGSIRGWMEKNRDAIQLYEDVEPALTSDPIQCMFCGPIARMRIAEARLRAWAAANPITVLKTEYAYRDLCILDVLNRDCSKGHALERWARFHGITAAEVVAIGDNHNDAEMLNFAGQAFIMENACEELQGMGWTRTLSNEDCGVAAVIEEVMS
jgi:Cof subfamily protein (haloacid dehalogenase superfamily)